MTCASCGTANEADSRFCKECGSPLARACPSCGRAADADAKFCAGCGASFAAATAAPVVATATPAAERRLVSVLFADLVGFTTASEGRDAEDTRDLLTRYFDASRTIIERYGGTVEKFIGDAVMAVWGAPAANEDDAERAVRAALELIEAIPGIDPGLQARAGVLTGEAVVSLGATDQGMVAGDLVNTASRIQSTAEPGTVLVGETTLRASESAIAYADGGTHALKGKSEPVTLWRALRVSTQRRGMGRAAGLDAPFVGRSAELRLVKDMFHASADEKRSRLVSVVGVAGIGKSRLSWEFEKYIDGLAADVWWHRGRCLSYGDGVAYWALAEMVRGRAKILEDEDAESSVTKLRAVLEANVGDVEERDWIEPRLLQLLGLSDRTSPDREDLFSAWRRFFERLAEQGPLVMVFEDIHWADEGLVAFVEYLLDWGRHHQMFVITLARPEIADRHPAFPGSMRSSTTLPLEPLDEDAMDELLLGLVPGLPDDVRVRLREAADGIPLYAVETVRMLRDRGVLEQGGGGDVVTGDLTAFEVPQSLQALITSRLDGVPEEERRLLQDASVLGKSFTRRGLSAVSGAPEEAVEPLVTSLVRKELLTIETDPFSPERGQLAFLQALVQRVTYETIARRDRRTRHLAAARYLSSDSGIDPDEIAEVIASHFLDAHEADPDASDRDVVRGEARRWFTRAAERAASLAASLEAQRAFERAAGLAGADVERGKSLARAGDLATMGGRFGQAESLLVEAISILDAAGARSDAAVAQARLAEVLFVANRIEESVALLQPALEAHMASGDEAAIATVSTQLGRMLFFEGASEEAMEHVERALELGERLRLTQVVVESLINKSLILQRRPNESLGLMRQALVLADETSFDRGVLRACMNLSYLLTLAGRNAEADNVIERGLELARRRGDRVWESSLMTNLISGRWLIGRWDDAEALLAELPTDAGSADDPIRASSMLDWATIRYHRGDAERAIELAAPIAAWGESARLQTEGVAGWARMIIAMAEDRPEDAFAIAVADLGDSRFGDDPVAIETLFDVGCEAAGRSADDVAELIHLLDDAMSRGLSLSARLRALRELQRVRVSVLRGGDGEGFAAAVEALGEIDDVFAVATAKLDHAESLIEAGRQLGAPALLTEARTVFEQLRAVRRIERLKKAEIALAAGSAGAAANL